MTDAGAKRCSTCKAVKSREDFYSRPNGTPVTACIPCTLAKQRAYQNRPDRQLVRRGQHLQRSFGMSSAEYDSMLEAQGGRCAICLEAPSKRLVVDHCHQTGAVRKLLCASCNLLVGNLEKDIDLVRVALMYIGQHSTINEMTR